METATLIPDIITVARPLPGQYVIRVGDLKYRPIAVAISKMLDDASSLILVTPADTKVFKVSPNGATAPMPVDASPDHQMEESDAPLDAETLAAIKAQEGHALPNADPEEATEAAPVEPEGPKVVRRKRSPSAAGRSESCRRCSGSGEIRSIVNDQPTTVPCPICQGQGTMIRYGDRR